MKPCGATHVPMGSGELFVVWSRERRYVRGGGADLCVGSDSGAEEEALGLPAPIDANACSRAQGSEVDTPRRR
jgi:hypothetical protein